MDLGPNDSLAIGMDPHTSSCGGEPCVATSTRTFLVASKILDEDWFKDEIRIDLHVQAPDCMGDTTTTTFSSSTVTGNF